jgi:hypothetical protein
VGFRVFESIGTKRSPGTAMNRGFSLFQGEVAMHHLMNDHSAFWEVRKEGSISGSIRAAGTMRHVEKEANAEI